MKRILLILVGLFFLSAKLSAQIRWDGGGGDGLWATAANWVGDILPGSTDDVLLDNSSLPGNYTVTLPSGTVSITLNSLIITPSGGNTINVTLPVSNTSSTALQIDGPGDAFVLNSGAIFINSSGASAGTPVSVTATNNFRINNGAKYVHNTSRGATFNLISRLSTVTGTELGEFEFDVPTSSFTISLSGRTFGILTLSSIANGGSVTYIGNGTNPVTINGNLNINSGVTLSISMSADFIINGNYNQAISSTFNLQSSTNNNLIKIRGNVSCLGSITETSTGLPTLELDGTSNQTVSIIGSINNSVTFRINNATGATLMSPITLPYSLILSAGKITTTVVNLLTMLAGSSVTGGSLISFINGPMKKVGNTDFTFPIGSGGIYAPIGISGGTGAIVSDEFTAEYLRLNPQNVHGNVYEGSINHISYVEYWTLDRIGAATKVVTLDVHETSFAKVLSNTFVTRYNGPEWSDIPSTPSVSSSCGLYQCGTTSTTNAMSNFGSFTLATDLDFISNPLPIKLIDFNYKKISNTLARINWEIEQYTSIDTKFVLEKSTDKSNFSILSIISGSETNRFYSYTDARLSKGTTWYRLKMTDVDGSVKYSKVIAIVNEEKGFLITSIAPNPTQDEATILLSAAKQSGVHFKVYDIAGTMVKQWYSTIAEGNNNINMNVAELARGVYHVLAYDLDSKATFRFIKQ